MAAKKPQMPRYDAVFRGDEARVSLAKLLWKEVIAALEEVSALSRVNLARADRYVRAKVEFEALYPEAAEAGPVTRGPNGGEVFSFTWSAVEKLNDRMLKLERAMFGEAQARPPAEKPKKGSAPADEFLGSYNGLRQ
ncbi:P27 family phage terminase small subunit [Ketogulonicigenium vulgare]|uniref:Uncharacterized protein n=1 Tax=Ketogulonicigenium vulgare (strain WSH-001) TaxID=759362 RepID=F9YA05_KETVW|nr:P27 family phage terminase small subunit [Ketogulonicigenium vulgare]AEM41416.1 hypothetical protein KVU_1577 [Ketogulonicigenium vulgare WSH-001]ALJ81550.1 hypothetical protein KVH_10410 [Ketogulonicigenium vulgare]ANW34248.1 hypothetical protein KvSKV_10350 [Ketogulonicigenium vulgare]AOZ55161.1 hypothetical protein KVC_2154 [Ketogulonicigenium vulgare]